MVKEVCKTNSLVETKIRFLYRIRHSFIFRIGLIPEEIEIDSLKNDIDNIDNISLSNSTYNIKYLFYVLFIFYILP